MGSFIKKDLLVFWRDRKEMLMTLLLPIIIIVVLNYAFAGIFNDDKEATKLDIAFVQVDDEEKGFVQFKEKIQQLGLSQAEKETMLEHVENLSPITLIRNFINNPDVKEWVNAKELTWEEATDQVESGELDAIIRVPEGFTYEVLSTVMLGDKSTTALTIHAAKQSTEVTTLQNIVNEFVNSLNMNFALGREGTLSAAEPILPQGGREVVEGIDTYTISQYFIIAIGTLFGLFLAQSVALKTVTEKRERVFNRILLTNSNPMHFLLGKTVSTFILAWLQLMITITVTQLLLNIFPDKSVSFWFGMVLVFTSFSLMVAGLSAIFTSITLNLKDSNAVSGLTTLIIMSLGVLGGSFFPLEGFPELLQRIGEWTPNGLTMIAMIEYIQFSQFSDLLLPIVVLVAMSVVCFVIGMFMFPKRGRV
ncbi:ABC transporter permease [Cytobacillus oceanisediminis]|uniref:ABC transporter permease n=1 Tax=Bacillaceae TaxID=186817 RepID=UPI00033288D2|nr:ABC transporter permease [Cytobacillus oceanisediminis]EOR22415.1 hypothetical protein A499_18119 [Niallia nealsonii AAU1]MBZ9533296.1 ABC transporter permease [Cytobacillus oceanisediminis]